MRKIDLKDINNPPAVLVSNSAGRKVRRAVENRNGNEYSGYHYKDQSVKDLLEAYSLGKHVKSADDSPKCFYCESSLKIGAILQVEHYRPKAKVDNIDNDGLEHSGYYWLGLEWTNLLLACPNCNQSPNKGTRFPVSGGCRALPIQPVNAQNQINRTYLIASQSPLSDEIPLLINPEIDEPGEHLCFRKHGQIAPKDSSIRGITSIEIYGLDRDTLLKARKEVLANYLKELNAYILMHKENRGLDDNSLDALLSRKLGEMITDSLDQSKTYSAWRKHYCSHFITCVLPEIDRDYRIRVYSLFRNLRTQVNP